jgi:hypothetical protein
VPITLAVAPGRPLLIATAVGDLSLVELTAFIKTGRTGDHRDWPLLFDAALATTHITAGQVRSLAVAVGSTVRLEGTRAPVAIVAGHDDVFGVMRMYQTLCEGEGFNDIGVFRTRDEAETWLAQQRGVAE